MSRSRPVFVTTMAVFAFAAACADTIPTATLSPGPTPRMAVTGAENPVVINEVMADPSAVPDDRGEWFEVHNTGATSVSLQGWTIRSNNDVAHTITGSVSVPAGGFAVLGNNGTKSKNGGVTVNYVYGAAINLANASDWLALRNSAGVLVDSVAWASSMPAGAARGVADPLGDNLDVKGSNWSTQTSLMSKGDKGTPGKVNDGYMAPPPPPPPPGDTGGGGGGGTASELVVKVLDIGQGDATLITNGTSKVIIDGGPSTARFGFLLDSLELNNTTIDVVILSHEHFDHLSGLRELFRTSRGITVRYFFENKNVYSTVSLAELRDSVLARESRGELIYRDTDDPCANGAPLCTVTMNGNAKLHIMRPNPNGTSPNNRSTPVKLVGPDSASFSMWFAGDAEHEAIEWFDTGANYDVSPGMKVNVLKADHHGSCNGVRSRYVDLLNPDWVTFSVGATNTYGHVHNQTKTLFSQYGKPWYRTDNNGTITFRTPGTAGGGYTVSAGKGSASTNGSTDATSAQSACSAL